MTHDPHSTPSAIEEHPARDLKTDQRVQRELHPSHVRKLANSMDLDAIGVVTVSRRKSGKLIILDGQHRIAALMHEDLGDWPVMCNVYDGLTLAQEAALFRRLNTSKAPSAYDRFTKGVVAGDQDCRAIAATVADAGLHVARQDEDAGIRAVVTLEAIHRGGGREGLLAALKLVTGAWGTGADSFNGHVLHGVGIVANRYNGDLDHAALRRKLAKYPGGPLGLLGDAKGMQRFQGGTIAKAAAGVIVATYNRGRASGQLPPL